MLSCLLLDKTLATLRHPILNRVNLTDPFISPCHPGHALQNRRHVVASAILDYGFHPDPEVTTRAAQTASHQCSNPMLLAFCHPRPPAALLFTV